MLQKAAQKTSDPPGSLLEHDLRKQSKMVAALTSELEQNNAHSEEKLRTVKPELTSILREYFYTV